MKEYEHLAIEEKWQQYWREHHSFKTTEDASKPKCYVLDMFPYPSGAGLHVGHPLGYIASDIYSRYKRLKGFNVLHPMGYDSFGLPAEQYAIQTGQHPAVTTEENIARYREQLDKIGLSFDWDREVRTSDPAYYKWTQWIFIQLFNSWYNYRKDRAEPIETLIDIFSKNGFQGNQDKFLTGGMELDYAPFTALEWNSWNQDQQQKVLLGFRLAYLSEAYVNWCPQLGTVLSNDEVKDGVSERGGYPVERKLMNQWSMRITAYGERLLNDLNDLDWSESLKETQRNWIGKSQGASVNFRIQDADLAIEVFTTRPDTIFGVSFIVIAPEHEMLESITTADCMADVMEYVDQVSNRSERERQTEVKRISGEFTGSYAVHPFTGQEIPIWTADYVLAGYGTGAVMAVPAHDSRDFAFARHFSLPILPVVALPSGIVPDLSDESYDAKEGLLINSDFLNGLEVKAAIKKTIEFIEKGGFGKGKTNYRLRDAIFGRQRYWGEPIPVYYKNGIPYCLPESALPLVLPEIDSFLPTASGEPPLARGKEWHWNEQLKQTDSEGFPLETTTMPGWAGSSWYYLRYIDPHNDQQAFSSEAVNYWRNVDLYLGGSEHATGHLLYVRFWTKFLYDRGFIPFHEPAQRLINQGMIQGRSNYVYRLSFLSSDGKVVESPIPLFVSFTHATGILNGITPSQINALVSNQLDLEKCNSLDILNRKGFLITPIHVDVNIVTNDVLDLDAFRKWRPEFSDAEFLLEEGKYICGSEVEKMSKSKHNVVNPDRIVLEYGADTLRLYEMFLGPLEQSKPWSTQGIEGVYRFLKKVWRLFYDKDGQANWNNDAPSPQSLKSLHKLIRKVADDIESFSFNTSVSSFMICLNEFSDQQCRNLDVLRQFLICLSPYAPHIAEELWASTGMKASILLAGFPEFNPDYLIENSFSYPVSINGKHRTNIEFPLDATETDVQAAVMQDATVLKWLEGKSVKKMVFVKGKIINLVVA